MMRSDCNPGAVGADMHEITDRHPLLGLVQAGASAMQRHDSNAARRHFLAAAQGLCLLARDSRGALRQRQAGLARRLYLQAVHLQAGGLILPGLLPEPSADNSLIQGTDSADLPRARLTDVIGCEEIKRTFLAKYLYPLRHPELAALYRQSGAGGVLMYGPPGTGKTFLARAMAGELGIPVYNLCPSDVLSKWLGDAEKRLAEVFDQARQHPAALIFVDEIEALAPSRDQAENNRAMERLLTQFLTELDGFRRNSGRLVFLAASNRPWDVDAALLRSGRFDTLAYVGLPDARAREAMLRQGLDGIPAADGLDLAAVAHRAEHFSGAEMHALAQLAANLAFLEAIETNETQPVRQQTLEDALPHIHRVATPEMLARYQAFSSRGREDKPSPPIVAPLMEPLARTIRHDDLPGDPLDEATFLPMLAIDARELSTEIDVLPFVCYALQHAGVAPIRRVAVKNNGREDSQNLVVEVALVPDDYGAPWIGNIPELKAGETWEARDIALPLRLERLRGVGEKERAHVRVTIRDKNETLFASTRGIDVLAYNEWLFLPEYLEFTAAFVQPNHAALHPVVEMAATRLEKTTGSRDFPGYQRGSREHVKHMLAALHETLCRDTSIDYINPPPSFERSGQKVRLVADTLAQRRGTCFDLAILQAALWEHVGLHPCLILVPGHAFLACWMEEVGGRRQVTRLDQETGESRTIQAALRDGRLLPINSVEITARRPLDEAIANARKILETTLAQHGDVKLIDIQASRRSVTPLP